MFRVPWSSASAGGCSSSFASPVKTSPATTASTLSKPNYFERNFGAWIGRVGREGGFCAADGCLLLLRVSDAGGEGSCQVSIGRRPKAAKERTRGRLCGG